MMKKRVVVFGAGVAGLAAAHELIEQGFDVTIYEKDSVAGGFCKSARMPEDRRMPSEYSYRGFGPWYHNTFALMRRIPCPSVDGKSSSVYEEELSRPIAFAITPDVINDMDKSVSSYYLRSNLKADTTDKVVLGAALMRTWCANKRAHEYARTNASSYLKKYVSPKVLNIVTSTFGPWIGIDPQRTSLHHAGMFFFKNTFPGFPGPYCHTQDVEGPAWNQGSNDGWLLLKRPANEAWFDPWLTYLREKGVKFVFNTQLTKINISNRVITSCEVSSKDDTYLVQADYYVMAIPPFAMRDIISRSDMKDHTSYMKCDPQYSVLKGIHHLHGDGDPQYSVLKDHTSYMKCDPQLHLFDRLVADSPHVQISFRIAFGERIHWSVKRTMIILTDSEFDITLFPQENTWSDDVYLGDGVKSLWSATACVSYVPGRLFGRPATNLTKEQFLEEVMDQMYRCEGLQSIISSANSGRRLESFPIVRREVWHEWIFSSALADEKTLTSDNPKWVNSTTNRQYQPTARTSIINLVLAGAHVQTSADLWSMEAAAESGRAAASLIVGKNLVLRQQIPPWIQTLRGIDDVLYSMGLPSVVDVLTASGTMYTRVPISGVETGIYTRVPVSDSEMKIYTRVPVSTPETGIYTRVPVSTQISTTPEKQWSFPLEAIMGQHGQYVDNVLTFEKKRFLGIEVHNINVAVVTVRMKYQFDVGRYALVSLKISCTQDEASEINDYLVKLNGNLICTERVWLDVPIMRIYWQKTGNPNMILHEVAPLWKKL